MEDVPVPEALGDLFAHLLQLKASGSTGADVFEPLFANGSVKILELKEAHRRMCEATEGLREATSSAMERLDASSLQLQNLLYEKNHYEKEIRLCNSFHSAYKDEELELLPAEAYASRDGVSAEAAATLRSIEDPHQQMLVRLEHELAFRQDTGKELEALKSSRDALAAEVALRRGAVTGLEGEVSRLRDVVLRLQKQYDIDVPLESTAHVADPLVRLLPPPLYLLYSHFTVAVATKPRRSAVRIEIVGRDIDALRARLRDDRTTIGSPAGRGSMAGTSGAQGLDASKNDGVHPLALRISVLKGSGGHGSEAQGEGVYEPILQATFWYAPEAHVVMVEAADEQQMHALERLFGEEETMPSVALEDTELPGKALAWAQIAAGLDIIPTAVETNRSKGAAAIVAAVQRYHRERRASAVLEKLLQLL